MIKGLQKFLKTIALTLNEKFLLGKISNGPLIVRNFKEF
jgi:hypothetical protein